MLLVKWLGIADRYSKMYLDRVLAPLGINSSQHMYITIICRNPGITQEQFTEMTHLNPSNITRALNALIQAGFLKKETSREDKRRNCLYPTQKAYAPNKIILDTLEHIEDALLEGYPKAERAHFEEMVNAAALRAIALNHNEGELIYGTDTDSSKSSGI